MASWVDDSTDDRMMPVDVSTLGSGVTAISAGSVHTCAIHSGAAKCWGFGGDGRLGVGVLADRDADGGS